MLEIYTCCVFVVTIGEEWHLCLVYGRLQGVFLSVLCFLCQCQLYSVSSDLFIPYMHSN